MVVCGLAVALRFFQLTNQSLWYDEGSSVFYSGGDTLWVSLDRLLHTHASERYQPLYFLVLRDWRQLLGNSEYTLRLFSVLCGFGSVIFVYLGARAVYGARHAMLSAVLLSTSAYAVYYSQEVRPYALLLLVASIQLWSLVGGIHALCPFGEHA